MVSLGALAIDNQQKHRIHIWDRDGNTRQAEPDQLFPSSIKQKWKINISSPLNESNLAVKSKVSKELLTLTSKFYYL
jgi:hypothetical protein